MDTSKFFDSYFNHAELNSMLVMEMDGTVLAVNKAFTKHYGYHNEEIKGKNFRILFNQRDIEAGKPELELESVRVMSQAHDENYVIDKNGNAIWSTGESILVQGEGKDFIVKDIVNLQSKRQLQLFLTETEELLERIFQYSQDVPMLILDGSMKIIGANDPFNRLFHLPERLEKGSRLAEINHPFWRTSDVKPDLATLLVTNQAIRNKRYMIQNGDDEHKVILLNSKIIDGRLDKGRKVFIIIEELAGEKV